MYAIFTVLLFSPLVVPVFIPTNIDMRCESMFCSGAPHWLGSQLPCEQGTPAYMGFLPPHHQCSPLSSHHLFPLPWADSLDNVQGSWGYYSSRMPNKTHLDYLHHLPIPNNVIKHWVEEISSCQESDFIWKYARQNAYCKKNACYTILPTHCQKLLPLQLDAPMPQSQRLFFASGSQNWQQLANRRLCTLTARVGHWHLKLLLEWSWLECRWEPLRCIMVLFHFYR